MIQIENVDFDGKAGTFDVILDGQRIEAYRAALDPFTRVVETVPPRSAAALNWGDHSMADVTAAFRTNIKKFSKL